MAYMFWGVWFFVSEGFDYNVAAYINSLDSGSIKDIKDYRDCYTQIIRVFSTLGYYVGNVGGGFYLALCCCVYSNSI